MHMGLAGLRVGVGTWTPPSLPMSQASFPGDPQPWQPHSLSSEAWMDLGCFRSQGMALGSDHW